MHLPSSQGSSSPGSIGIRTHLCWSKWLWFVQHSFLDLWCLLLILNYVAVSLEGDIAGIFGFYNYYDYNSESFHLEETSGFALFASCWTVSFTLYLVLTSATVYTRSDRPIGRFFNQRFVFAVDCLSAVFWFASFISQAHFIQAAGSCRRGYDVCGTMTTSILIAVFLWYDHCLPLTLRGSTDGLAVSPSSQQPSWLRVTCFVPVRNVPKSTLVRSSIGVYRRHGSKCPANCLHGRNTH